MLHTAGPGLIAARHPVPEGAVHALLVRQFPCSVAANVGRQEVKVVQRWASDGSLIDLNVCAVLAVGGGHLDVIRWLAEASLRGIPVRRLQHRLVRTATRRGHLHVRYAGGRQWLPAACWRLDGRRLHRPAARAAMVGRGVLWSVAVGYEFALL
jgi:hypothetical protein